MPIKSTLVFLLLWTIYSYPISGGMNPKILQMRAQHTSLHMEQTWLKLGHYMCNGSTCESEIDSPDFFLSPQGRTSPEMEMTATLNKLFSGDSSCIYRHMYPARYRYLTKALRLTDSDVADFAGNDSCDSEFTSWLNYIQPDSLAFIFASSYLKNPASMVGHLFLKVTSTRDSAPNSFVIDYTADVKDANPISYIVNGVSGGYQGRYHINDYKSYADKYLESEQRDLWTYMLNVSREDVLFILEHYWEIKDAWMDYYFFTENCAYNLLSLAQISLDSDYTATKRRITPPSEIITIMKRDSLVAGISYKPSLFNSLPQRIEQFSEREMNLLAVFLSESDSVYEQAMALDSSGETASRILSFAIDLRYIQSDEQNIPQKLTKLLILRQKFPFIKETSSTTIDSAYAPHLTHFPSRIGIFGIASDKGATLRLSYRLGIHDNIQKRAGFIRGSIIEAGKVDLDIVLGDLDSNAKRISLEELRFFHIASFPDFNSYTHAFSWQVDSRLYQPLFHKHINDYTLSITGGGGLATHMQWAVFYALAKIDAGYNISTNQAHTEPGFKIGAIVDGFDVINTELGVEYVKPIYQYKKQRIAAECKVLITASDRIEIKSSVLTNGTSIQVSSGVYYTF